MECVELWIVGAWIMYKSSVGVKPRRTWHGICARQTGQTRFRHDAGRHPQAPSTHWVDVVQARPPGRVIKARVAMPCPVLGAGKWSQACGMIPDTQPNDASHWHGNSGVRPAAYSCPAVANCHLLGSGNQLHPKGLYQPALTLSHHTPTGTVAPPGWAHAAISRPFRLDRRCRSAQTLALCALRH